MGQGYRGSARDGADLTYGDFWVLAGGLIAASAVAAMAYWFCVAWASTGPDCPNNPDWLGYCADAPARGER